MKYIEKNISSKKKGKKVLIVCGTHGNESRSVRIVDAIIKHWSEYCEELEGSKIIKVGFVLLNEEGLEQNSREFVYDTTSSNGDLNRAFFKPNTNTLEEIVKKLKEIIFDYDIVVDVHNSPNCINCCLIDYDDSRIWEKINKVKKTKFEPVIRATQINTIKKYINSFKDKEGYTLEISGMGFDTDFSWGVERYEANNILFFVKEIADFAEEKKNYDFDGKYVFPLSTRTKGIIRYEAEPPLRHYKKGDSIAYISDFGSEDVLETVKAPCNGVLVDVSESYYLGGYILGEFMPEVKEK